MADEFARVDLAAILGRTTALLRASPLPALFAFLGLVALSVAIDVFGGADGVGLNTFASIAGVFAQFLVTQALLRNEDWLEAEGQPGRVASFIGVGFVTGLAIALGWLLLIVPGLYLYARWSIVDPLVIGHGAKMGEAMRISAERTRGGIGAIMLAVLLLNLPLVGSILLGAFTFASPHGLTVAVIASVITNALLYASLLSLSYCAVAIYLLTAPDHPQLTEIFA